MNNFFTHITAIVCFIIIFSLGAYTGYNNKNNPTKEQSTIDSLKQECKKKDKLVKYISNEFEDVKNWEDYYQDDRDYYMILFDDRQKELKECIKSNNHLMYLLNRTRDSLDNAMFKIDVLENDKD